MTAVKLLPYGITLILLIAVFWFRGNAIDAEAGRDMAEAKLTLAREANEKQASTIEQLVQRKARDDQILADISLKLAGIHQGFADTTEKITGLEKTNEDVRAYLEGIIPDALCRVLNRP